MAQSKRTKAFEEFLADIKACQENHSLKQVGSCVYCIDCDKRLYQGTIPKEATQ